MIIVPTEKRFDWNRPPFILLLLVFVNFFVFFAYQSGDDEKVENAFRIYFDNQYFDAEWPLYLEYLKEKKEERLLKEVKGLYEDEFYDWAAYGMLIDNEFFDYLKEHEEQIYSDYDKRVAWYEGRYEVNKYIDGLSTQLGLFPNHITIPTLFTHQFLHGGLMHLLGNMIFLIMCGFAVEAAIGHLRFLAFYLVCGVAAGLSHAVIDLESSTPLIGASGAISGIMAIYVAIFRLKKIEFFYWFYVFVGYVRLPSLMVLPFYIAKELLSFWFDKESNVAFMAHAGGFVTGGILIFASYLINKNIFDEEYIEEDQDVDPYQNSLNTIYTSIAKFQFKRSLNEIDAAIKEFGSRFELMQLKFNLLRINNNEKALVIPLISYKHVNQHELEFQENLWNQYPDLRSQIPTDQLANTGMRFANKGHMEIAEEILDALKSNNSASDEIAVLAKRLSVLFAEQEQSIKSKHYEELANQLGFSNGKVG